MNEPARRIAGVLLLLLAATLLASAAREGTAARISAAPPTNVRVEPVASRVDWSDGSFSIRIELSDLDHHGTISYDDDRDTVPDREVLSDGLGAFEILFYFNPAVLQVTDVQAGDFIRSAGRSAHCFQRIPEPGQYALGCVSTGSAPGPQGTGTLATITLLPLANGTSFLGLEADLAGPLADPIPATVDGGIVEVFGVLEATPTPEPEGPEDGAVPGPGPTDGDASAEGDRSPAGSLPLTGTGYQPPGAAGRLLALGSALAIAGSALLLLASRLAARARG